MKPSRRTITTPNRFITFIQSWQVKSVALGLPWVLLLFFSCKDNASLVGFRKEPRLATRYVEIPLDYSVFLREPILMQNFPDDETSRLLVGQVNDPDLGSLEATAYFNYSPPIEPVFPTSNAVFQRLELVLKFDYYALGPTDSTDMQLQAHELQEQLTPERLYYSGTYIPYNPTPVGDTTFAIGPQQFKEGWATATDNNLTNNLFYRQPIRLSETLGQSLLNDLINDRSLIEDFNAFSAKYTGFALKMPVGNKILGFSPVYSLPTPAPDDSRLVLTYRESGATILVDFPIFYASVNNALQPVVTFTYLAPNRSGTALDGLLPFTDLVPTDGNMYGQSGTGIMPKLSLSKVYEYFDTIPNATINSAELVFDNTYTGRTPEEFELLLLDSNNQYRDIYLDTLIGSQNVRFNDPYIVKISTGIEPYGVGVDETRVAALNILTGRAVKIDQETGKIGLTIMNEFFQQIVDEKTHPRRAVALAFHPFDNEFNKTVSIVKLAPSSARLRVYFTKPITLQP